MGKREGRRQGSEETGAGRGRPRGRRQASVLGRGWDILVGGANNAARYGGDDPFDEVLPDAEAGLAGMSAPPRQPPPRDLTPDELMQGLSTPAADQTALFPDLDDEAGLPRTIAGRSYLADDADEPDLPAASVTPDADQTALFPDPDADVTGLPMTLSGEPYPALTDADTAADESLPALPAGEPAVETILAAEAEAAEMPSAQGLADARPEDPFEEEPLAPDAADEEIPPDADFATRLITQERVDALWDEINQTYNAVIADVRGYRNATDTALADLKQARELLLAGSDHYDNAEEIVKRVKATLKREEKVRQWSRTRGTLLAVYLVVWLIGLIASAAFAERALGAVAAFVPDWLAAATLPGLFGGLGGVIGALWVLIKHIARQRDFDPVHSPWYITNPIMGISLGVVAYFLLRGSTALLGVDTPAGEPGSPGLYALCVIVGFNQNVLWSLVDRVVDAVLPGVDSTSTSEETAEE